MVHERAEHASDSSAVIEESRSVSHTPGPWEHVPERLYEGRHVAGRGPRIDTLTLIIADVRRVDHGSGVCEVAEANARLIAAAPEMLEALKTIREWLLLDESLDARASQFWNQHFVKANNLTNEVIAKAEGK